MLLRKDSLLHIPVMSLQTGTAIAETNTLIIDPRQLKVVAFYCSGPRLDVVPAILTTSDIREIGDLGILVDSAEVLMSPDDLVRLKEVLEFQFRLDGKKVVTESGEKLGSVADFTLDSTTLYIVKLHVRPGIWQSLTTAELVIDRTQVVQVTDDEVVVRDADTRRKAPAQAARPVIENPFRGAPVEGAAGHHIEK